MLIIDDDGDVRDVYAIYLRYEGFNVAVAEDGLTGLAYAQQHRVDIVILDLTMPRMDGFEVTRQLRAHDRTRHLPIIVFSGGFGRTTDAQDALAAGANAYCTKPCLPETLSREVKRLLQPPQSRTA